MTIKNFENFENFKSTFEKVGKFFNKFHIHVTFDGENDCSLRQVHHILPFKNGEYFIQHQTSITIAGLKKGGKLGQKQFLKICNILEPYIEHIIGYKIEGLVDGDDHPSKEELGTFFKYIENHKKSNNLDDFKDEKCILSMSLDCQKFYTVERYYNFDDLNFSNYEVAIYDDQLIPFEQKWCENDCQYETLKALCAKLSDKSCGKCKSCGKLKTA